MKKNTLNKLLSRIDHFDGNELQNYLLRLAKQQGLFKQVFEVIEEGIVIINQNGNIIFANQTIAGLLQKDVQHIKRSDLDLLMGHEQVLDVIFQQKAAVSHDAEISYPEHRFLNLYIAPLGEDSTTYVIVVRDVTREHVTKEQDLEAEQLNALTLLAAGVAHEIGNPLNSIGLHLQILERKISSFNSLSDQDRNTLLSLLATTKGETSRLDSILKQFLQAIRPGKQDREPTRLDPLIKEILNVLRPEIEARNINIELKLASDPPLLMLDQTQIKQALYNLIKNAYQSLPNEGGSIIIATEHNAYEAAVIVADSGSGISPEIMGSIYEPFLTSKKSGTGLGLLIVRRIVKDHGGSMTIASPQGSGTTVTLLFPRLDKPRNMLTEKES